MSSRNLSPSRGTSLIQSQLCANIFIQFAPNFSFLSVQGVGLDLASLCGSLRAYPTTGMLDLFMRQVMVSGQQNVIESSEVAGCIASACEANPAGGASCWVRLIASSKCGWNVAYLLFGVVCEMGCHCPSEMRRMLMDVRSGLRGATHDVALLVTGDAPSNGDEGGCGPRADIMRQWVMCYPYSALEGGEGGYTRCLRVAIWARKRGWWGASEAGKMVELMMKGSCKGPVQVVPLCNNSTSLSLFPSPVLCPILLMIHNI